MNSSMPLYRLKYARKQKTAAAFAAMKAEPRAEREQDGEVNEASSNYFLTVKKRLNKTLSQSVSPSFRP